MQARGKVFQKCQVGDIVRTTDSFGPNQAGSVGIVYETYPDNDVEAPEVISILLTNGHDIGSFNGEEQTESLIWLGNVEIAYAYSDPAQLMKDYRNGYFDQAFAGARTVADLIGSDSIAH